MPLIPAKEVFTSAASPSFRYQTEYQTTVLNRVCRTFLDALELRTGSLYARNGPRFDDPRWEKLLKTLEQHGGVYSLSQNSVFTDEVKMYFFDIFMHPAAKTGSGHLPNFTGFGRGVSDDYFEALSKVFGEFLERYALLYYENEWLLRASVSHLKQKKTKFIHPESFAGFSAHQRTLPHNRDTAYDENSLFQWIPVREISTGKEVLVPAQFVSWVYCRHHEEYTEPRLVEPNTNGAGGYFTRDGAILSGLYELIQRDAFFLYWFNTLSPKRIDIATVTNPRLTALFAQAKRLRFEVVFLDITSDFKIPTVVCVLLDHSGIGPKISLGAGCGQNPDEVLRRAFTEACGLHHWLRLRSERYMLPEKYEPFSNTWMDIGQMERLLLWANSDMFPHIAFFFSGAQETYADFASNSRTFSDETAELVWLTQHLSSAGYESFYYESKHHLLQKTGYFAAQAIVPGLIPLYLREIDAPLGAKRIKTGVERMGKKPADILNPLPHPFP